MYVNEEPTKKEASKHDVCLQQHVEHHHYRINQHLHPPLTFENVICRIAGHLSKRQHNSTEGHFGTCAETMGILTFEAPGQVLELKQTSSTSGGMSRHARGHMLHVTVQCLPAQLIYIT